MAPVSAQGARAITSPAEGETVSLGAPTFVNQAFVFQLEANTGTHLMVCRRNQAAFLARLASGCLR